jgi:hypothetical protein
MTRVDARQAHRAISSRMISIAERRCTGADGNFRRFILFGASPNCNPPSPEVVPKWDSGGARLLN